VVPRAYRRAQALAFHRASLAGRQTVAPAGGHGKEGTGFNPADLQRAYNVPSATGGSGQTVAIVDVSDNPYAESDLAVYRATYGLPACTTANGCFKKVNQNGVQGSYPPQQPGTNWSTEISADIELVSAICPNCHILLVEANAETDVNMATAENTAAALGANEISNSWGHSETLEDISYDGAFNHPGVVITAASGDTGYEGGGGQWPATAPHVLSVGGTSLFEASNARGFQELTWSLTGSGCAAGEPKPSWQTDTGCQYRTMNDISAVADWKNTPVSVYDNYPHQNSGLMGWESFGGTSVATPIIAAVYALTDAYTRSLGPQAIWQYAKEGAPLNDIVSGSNHQPSGSCAPIYLCWAGPGYDGPTGWGTPWGAPTVKPLPTAITEPASEVKERTAKLEGYVNPNGLDTRYYFEYGHTTAYGSAVPALPGMDIGAGTGLINTWNPIGQLSPAADYHYRVVATSSAGTSYGGDRTFHTAVEPNVAFVDASTNNALGVWRWNEETGWSLTQLFQDAATAGTSPSAVLNNGLTNVLFADANTNNEISDWAWSNTTGWTLTRLFQDAAATGSSPCAVMVNGALNVLFVDASTSNTISDWVWSATSGWQLSRFYSDKVAAGTSPTAVVNNGVLNVIFDDASAGNTIADWVWSPSELKLSHFYGDTVAAGTSPSAVVNNGVLNAVFDDASAANTIADWVWSPSELKLSHFYGDAVAAGTSPSAVVNSGALNVFFDDASASSTIADWVWAPTELKVSHFNSDAVAAKTSPSSLARAGVPMTFFTDAATNNEVAYWQWAPTELTINRLFQDPAAAGTSPSAVG
jgi:hypothetical protein